MRCLSPAQSICTAFVFLRAPAPACRTAQHSQRQKHARGACVAHMRAMIPAHKAKTLAFLP
nr:MAG TPA: hypothetical protein [Caudoviricetes sp.]